MTVILAVRVEGFRSLRRASLVGLDDYVPIIGMNGTGKSNALRALNLFFNETIDADGVELDLAEDFTDHLKGKKREVSVEVTFSVAERLLPKGTSQFVDSFQIGDTLTIRRHWQFLTGSKQLVENIYAAGTLLEAGSADRAAALAVIRSVTFRYVSNHVRPADVVRDNVRTLRPTLVKRAKQSSEFNATDVDKAMEGMTRIAEKMFRDMSGRVALGAREIERVAADMPDDFTDLAFDLALRTVSSAGIPQLVDRQGSGSQSFLLMHLLDLLDSAARERGYGWVQQHIWAVEEPESFLHAALRSRFAHDLRSYGDFERRQILATTHQDEFIRVADHAWSARLEAGSTTFVRSDARTAVLEASRLRVTSFQHPLLTWSEVPLVIVEGKTDAAYLRLAIVEAGLRPRWRIVTIEDLEPTLSGGSNVVNYLKQNPSLVAARSDTSPLIVVMDWEVKDRDLAAAKAVLGGHPTSTAVRIPGDLANEQLGPQFRGIERMLPTDIVRAVLPEDALKPRSVARQFPLGVDKSTLESHKSALVEAASDADSIGPDLIRVVQWVDRQVDIALGDAPPELFL